MPTFSKDVCRALLLAMILGVGGCKDLTGSPQLPSGTPNPNVFANAAGAIGMRNVAFYWLEQELHDYISDTGLLTDELEDLLTGASAGVLLSTGGQVRNPLDERFLAPQGIGGSQVLDYSGLQKVRGQTQQALGALAAYDTAAKDTAAAKVLRGELYAIEGYADILLADLFCSGVPLSTLDFQADFTYAPSSTTAQVYQAAVFKFDTALTLGRASDSVRFLAQILKGRAKLALASSPSDYVAAADDVTTVPDAFQYQVFVPIDVVGNTATVCVFGCQATVSDSEGVNGLRYRSSGDPRTATIKVGDHNEQTDSDSLYFPVKYSIALTNGSGYAPFTVGSGIEARLIQAEAALNAGQITSMLATLNALRLNAATNTNGVIPALPGTLTDPGASLSGDAAAAARIKLLFRERAFWLFLDGHRQGDLRRLLRQYGSNAAFHSQQQVYPTGQYLAPGIGTYGSDVTAPIDGSEFSNPLFHGCLDRNP